MPWLLTANGHIQRYSTLNHIVAKAAHRSGFAYFNSAETLTYFHYLSTCKYNKNYPVFLDKKQKKEMRAR